eukprot:8733879-Alexandrium_andersonii.AAC.1
MMITLKIAALTHGTHHEGHTQGRQRFADQHEINLRLATGGKAGVPLVPIAHPSVESNQPTGVTSVSDIHAVGIGTI